MIVLHSFDGNQKNMASIPHQWYLFMSRTSCDASSWAEKKSPLWIRENLIVSVGSHKLVVCELNIVCQGVLFEAHDFLFLSFLKLVSTFKNCNVTF